MKNKPDFQIDQKFLKRLKKELRTEAGRQKEGLFTYLSGALQKKLVLIPAGVAILFLALVLSFDFWSQDFYPGVTQYAGKNSGGKIIKLEAEAFGNLTLNQSGSEEQSLGVDGGGQLNKQIGEAEVDGRGAGGDAGISSEPLIAPNRINYEFVYEGENLDAVAEKLPVYKKTSSQALRDSFPEITRSWNPELIDLSQFRNLEPNHLNLVQDKNEGYFLNFNFSDGSVSLNKNWETWSSPKLDCQTPECYDSYRLKPEDVPGKEKIISLANEFLARYKIDTSSFGEPELRDHWRETFALSQDKENFRVPEELNVVYPLKIQGQTVHETSGEPTGLYVNVDIRSQKVSGLRNLFEPSFQSSDYDTINNSEEIISLAEKGGLRKPYEHQDPTETVTITLGTPKQSLVKVWNYNQGESTELFAPAHIFPVTNTSKQTYYSPENIVVPLVKELIQDANPIIGIPEAR